MNPPDPTPMPYAGPQYRAKGGGRAGACTDWTRERVALVGQLWADGETARDIARRIGPPCTRMSVLGIVHRHGFRRDAVDVAECERRDAARRAAEERAARITEAGAQAAARGGAGNVEPLPKWACRWPIKPPGRFGVHICGATVQPGRKFCARHITEACGPNKRAHMVEPIDARARSSLG